MMDQGDVFIFKRLFQSKKEIWLKDILSKNESSLIRYVLSLVKDSEIAQDIVQDSFLKLWEQDQAHLSGRETEWLFTVCRNKAYDVLRKKERKHIHDSDLLLEIADSSLSAEQKIEEHEQTQRIEALIGNLTDTQKEVMKLKFQEGLSYKQISQITGMSVNHVGVFIHNLVTHLKENAEQGGRLEKS